MKLRQSPTPAAVVAVLTAVLCSVTLYRGLTENSQSSLLTAAASLIVMIFAIRWAMRKPDA